MRVARSLAVLLVVGAVAPVAVSAQRPTPTAPADTVARQVLRTRDGSTFVGRVVSEDSASVRFQTSSGTLTVDRATVLAIDAIRSADMHGEEYWFPDPNRTRLFFGPTGRMLDAGEGYYMNADLILQNFAAAAGNYVTLGGGFSLIPGVDPGDWLYYLTPKVGVYRSDNLNAAVGALAGFVRGGGAGGGRNGFGVLYGVATAGGPNASVSGGLGFGYAGSKIESRPVYLVGGEKRVSRRVALLTENYAFIERTSDFVCAATCSESSRNRLAGAVSYGMRFLGEKLSVDFGFFNLAGHDTDLIFPGIPYLSFTAKY